MRRRFPLILLAALLVSGCSAVPWLDREEDPRPPAQLSKLTPEITVTTLWSRKVGKGTDGRRLNLVPALAGGQLLVADAEGLVAAVSTSGGATLWERKTGLPLSGGPEVGGGRVFVGSTDGHLIALSADDGTQLWRTRLDTEILSRPRLAGDVLVVHALDDSIHAFDAATGEARWSYRYPAPVLTLRGSSTPAIADGQAIVGISAGRLVSLDLETGVPTWEIMVTPPRGRSELERITDIDADPVVVDDMVYVGTYNGDLAAVERTSGTVLWRRSLSAHAGLAAAGGMLYVTDSDDHVWAAHPADGAGVWRQEALQHRDLSAPAVTGDLVVVGDLEGYIHWLARQDGRLVARTRVGKEPITAGPLVADGRVYVLGDGGALAVLVPDSPPPPPPAQPEAPDTAAAPLPGT